MPLYETVSVLLAEAFARVLGRDPLVEARRRARDAGLHRPGPRAYLTDDDEELRWTCR